MLRQGLSGAPRFGKERLQGWAPLRCPLVGAFGQGCYTRALGYLSSGGIVESYVITYDLKDGTPSPYRPFIEEAEKQGLLYVWRGKNKVHRLPNTTVWGRFETIEDARSAFDKAVRRASRRVGYTITVEKRMTVEAADISVKSNVSKAPVPKWTAGSDFRTSRLHQLNDPFFA